MNHSVRLFLITALLCGADSYAQIGSRALDSEKIEEYANGSVWKKRDLPLSAAVGGSLFQRIEGINLLIDEEQYPEALTELEATSRRRLAGYEEAVIFQMTGYVHGLLGNTDLSIEYWEKALATEALTPDQYQGVLYSLAHQYAKKLDFEKAILLMTDWFLHEEEPFADAFMFTGTCFSALKQYDNALLFVEKAVDKSDRPIESWYQMALSLQFELEKYEDAVATLKVMVQYWNRIPEYWEQLAGAYLEIGDDRAALDTTMIAYINGMVKMPQRILGLVELNLVYGIPLTAGEILETEMNTGVIPKTRENLDILIRIWIGAREYDRAILAIDKIAKIADAGNYYMQAAQLSVQAGDWDFAASSAKKALDAGYENRVKALTMMGTAYSEQGFYSQSIETFEQVREIGSDTERGNAERWIEFAKEMQAYQANVAAPQ